MNRSLIRYPLGILVVIACALTHAQTSGLIEEIIVTAQKREQNLQDTPISVTAFSGAAIEQMGFRQSVDITAQTPNFSVGYPNGESGVPALFIRGVGLSDFRVFTPAAVAPYADEVYVAQNAGQIFQLLDLERIEVLRGPQGTLYGRNATGGAVNYIARKPTEEWEGWARASAAEYGYTKFEGAAGGPISDQLGIRISALKTDSDGWLENNFTGNDVQGLDELAWRALIEWDVNDDLDLLFNVHGGSTKNDASQYGHLGVWTGFFSFTNCATSLILAGQCVDALGYSENFAGTTIDGIAYSDASSFDEGNYNLEAENDTDFWGVSLKANWQIEDILLTSITAFDDLDDLRPEETDASPNALLEGVLGVEQETFSQELRLSQQREGWSWIAGGYYLNDEASDQTGFDVLPFLRPGFVGVDDPAICADAQGIGPPPGNPSGFCPGGSAFTTGSRSTQEITSWSLFGDASIDLSEAVTLDVGLRYTDEEVKLDVLEIYVEPAAGNPVRLSAKSTENFDNVSGRAIANWRVTDDVLLYGGISTGFKGGGIDNDAVGVAPFDSEDLISYEAGFKTMLLDGRVRFNGALFFYDYSDLQVFTFVVVGAQAFSVLTNASDAEIFGGELELQWLPTDTTFVNLGLGYLDTEYEDFIDSVTGNDLSGNEIVMSPELSFNGLVQQDIPLGNNGTLTLQLDFSYQDDVFFDPQNNPLLSEDSYWIWNGRISWASADDKWEVAAWGRNLGDEEYLVYAFDLSFLGFNEEMLGIPRTIGAEATYRF